MTHIPEISAENRYQKTGMVSGASNMQFGTDFFWYQFSVRIRQCSVFVPIYGTSFLIRVFGAGFWWVCHRH